MNIRDERGALTKEWIRSPCYIFDIIPVATSTIRYDEWETRTDYKMVDLDLTETVRFMDNGYCRFVLGGAYGVTDETLARLDELYDRQYEDYCSRSNDVTVWRYVRREPLKYEYFNGSSFDYDEYLEAHLEKTMTPTEKSQKRVIAAVIKAKRQRIADDLAKETLTEKQAENLYYEQLTLERMVK
ncbi:hypothetical protein VPHD479_0097 [Vibrio phage D479]